MKTPPPGSGWQVLPEGATVPEAGNSAEYAPGNWIPHEEVRFFPEHCAQCGLCWQICPDDAIVRNEAGQVVGVNREHCKRCGLCIKACPITKTGDADAHPLRLLEQEEEKQNDF